jgi:peroxiredoxin
MRSTAFVAALAALVAISGGNALAAPFAGTGHAGIGGSVDGLKARDQALERARKVALEAAIEQLGASDPAARKAVLAAPAAWTRSYRVLRQDDDGATATAVVSVEIDTARLAKALAAPGAASPTSSLVVLPALELRMNECPPALEGELRRALVAAGVVRDVAPGSAGPVLSASLECRKLGTVSYPHQVAVHESLQVAGAAPVVATGFGEDAQAAASDAMSRLIGVVTRDMAKKPDGLAIRVAAPWPAARVRRLERALRDSVVGVQSVRVASIASDGAVTLQVEGGLTAEELQARLPAVQVPGASLVVGEVESSHVVHIRLQAVAAP